MIISDSTCDIRYFYFKSQYTLILANKHWRYVRKILLEEKHDGSGSPAGEEEATEEQTVQENGSGNDEDDDEWAPEPMEDPEKLSTQIGKLVLDKDLDKPENDRLDMLEQFFIKAKKDGTIQVIFCLWHLPCL